jgi:hypothetical protein
MKRCVLVIVVVLTLCATTATAAPGEILTVGASAGIAGFFGGGAYLPIDLFIQWGHVDEWLILRTDLGIVLGLGSPGPWFDMTVGVGFVVFGSGYGIVDFGGWLPLVSGLDLIEDSVLVVKPGVGYTWKGFFAELYVPFTIMDEDPGLNLGWEIRAGYRLSARL